MRLDAKREHEVEKRKGLTSRVIIIIIWLAFCFAAAYLFILWLVNESILRLGFFYNQLYIPRTVSEEIIILGAVVIVVVAINFFVIIGFALASSGGRRRPGTPSMYSSDPDPDDRKFDYR